METAVPTGAARTGPVVTRACASARWPSPWPSVVLTPVAMVVARRTGVVDRPGPLKPQAAPVPYLGGVAVFLAALVGAALGHPTVVAPLAGAVVLGVLDDRFDLPGLGPAGGAGGGRARASPWSCPPVSAASGGASWWRS